MPAITDNGDGNYLLDFSDSDIGTFAIRIDECGAGIGTDPGEGQGTCPCIGVENDTDIDAVAFGASSATEYTAATLTAYPDSNSELIKGTGQIWYLSSGTDQWWFWKEWDGSKWAYRYYYQDDTATAVLTVINCIDDTITDNADGTYSYTFTDTSPATTTVTWDMSTICFAGIVPGNSVAGVFSSGVTFDGGAGDCTGCATACDFFDDTDNTELDVHTPDVGGASFYDEWTDGGVFSGDSQIEIVGNEAIHQTAEVTDTAVNTFDYLANGEISITGTLGTADGVNQISMIFRKDPSSDDHWKAGISIVAGGFNGLFISKSVSGSYTDNLLSSLGYTAGTEYTLTLTFDGNDLEITDGTNTLSVTDSFNASETEAGISIISNDSDASGPTPWTSSAITKLCIP